VSMTMSVRFRGIPLVAESRPGLKAEAAAIHFTRRK
jgi:hypothetical protein